MQLKGTQRSAPGCKIVHSVCGNSNVRLLQYIVLIGTFLQIRLKATCNEDGKTKGQALRKVATSTGAKAASSSTATSTANATTSTNTPATTTWWPIPLNGDSSRWLVFWKFSCSHPSQKICTKEFAEDPTERAELPQFLGVKKLECHVQVASFQAIMEIISTMSTSMLNQSCPGFAKLWLMIMLEWELLKPSKSGLWGPKTKQHLYLHRLMCAFYLVRSTACGLSVTLQIVDSCIKYILWMSLGMQEERSGNLTKWGCIKGRIKLTLPSALYILAVWCLSRVYCLQGSYFACCDMRRGEILNIWSSWQS